MLDNTRRLPRPRRICIEEKSRLEGGYYDRESNWALTLAPSMFKVIRRKPAQQVQPSGRRPRPEPRTMPLLVALPLLAWMLWTGEIKWR